MLGENGRVGGWQKVLEEEEKEGGGQPPLQERCRRSGRSVTVGEWR